MFTTDAIQLKIEKLKFSITGLFFSMHTAESDTALEFSASHLQQLLSIGSIALPQLVKGEALNAAISNASGAASGSIMSGASSSLSSNTAPAASIAASNNPDLLSLPGSLPVTLDISPFHRLHSYFICPVSREYSSQPVLLKCGHVISAESVNKITRGNVNRKFKCPTCPVEMLNTSETRPLCM
jgi:hypothetical protein